MVSQRSSKSDTVIFHNNLINVLKQYPTEKIVMVLDISKVHHAKLLKPFLKENSNRLTLVFLPPYSPRMNIFEVLWGWMKEAVINNAFFSNVQEMDFAKFLSCNPFFYEGRHFIYRLPIFILF